MSTIRRLCAGPEQHLYDARFGSLITQGFTSFQFSPASGLQARFAPAPTTSGLSLKAYVQGSVVAGRERAGRDNSAVRASGGPRQGSRLSLFDQIISLPD